MVGFRRAHHPHDHTDLPPTDAHCRCGVAIQPICPKQSDKTNIDNVHTLRIMKQ